MIERSRYQINEYNQGPFKMYQVVDTNYDPPRALYTTKHKDRALEFIKEESKK